MKRADVQRSLSDLHSALATRIGDSGWVSDKWLHELRRGLFVKDLGRDWSALLTVISLLEGDNVAVVALMGIEYRPATRLANALTGSPVRGALIGGAGVSCEINHRAEAGRAADTTAGFANGHALHRASALADVDRLVAGLQDGQLRGWRSSLTGAYAVDILGGEQRVSGRREARWLVPAVLAASGRTTQALGALDSFAGQRWGVQSEPDDEIELDSRREIERFDRQLRRWIAAGAILDALPASPPRWPPTREPRVARVDFAEIRRQVRDRKHAVDAAREGGGDRQAVRSRLEQELRSRGVRRRARQVEEDVDRLLAERETDGGRRKGFDALRQIGKVGVEVARAVQAGHRPDPEWMRPPMRAGYPIEAEGKNWSTIRLDEDAQAWLERCANAAGPRVAGTATVEVWIEPERSIDQDGPIAPPVVHLGESRIGVLTDEDARQLMAALSAAADRDEAARCEAQVSRTSGGWLVELNLPLAAEHLSAARSP